MESAKFGSIRFTLHTVFDTYLERVFSSNLVRKILLKTPKLYLITKAINLRNQTQVFSVEHAKIGVFKNRSNSRFIISQSTCKHRHICPCPVAVLNNSLHLEIRCEKLACDVNLWEACGRNSKLKHLPY